MKLNVQQILTSFPSLDEIDWCPPAMIAYYLGHNRNQLRKQVEIYKNTFLTKLTQMGGSVDSKGNIRFESPLTDEVLQEIDAYDTELKQLEVEVDIKMISITTLLTCDPPLNISVKFFDFCSFMLEEN